MKMISLEERHERTTESVEAAQHEELTITHDGQAVAVLSKAPPSSPQKRWPQMTPEVRKADWEERERDLAAVPPIDVDSTVYVSEDRDRW